MKNPLKKLSRADQPDRREALEQDAAEQIKQVTDHTPPPETSATAWVHAEAAAPDAQPTSDPTMPAPAHADQAHAGSGERRLTVQERMAARR